MTSTTSVIVARKIVTMNPSAPVATHVAVRNGRILAIGGESAMADVTDCVWDDRFRDKVLLPGFVEGHAHFLEGAIWRHPYVGFFDRADPDGVVHAGLADVEAVIAHLAGFAARGDRPVLAAWGFDPIYLPGIRLTVADLDRVSTERPVIVTHASGHIMNVNTLVLDRVGITPDADLDGLLRDAAGKPTGELMGLELLGRVRRLIGADAFSTALDAAAMRSFGDLARRSGVTTAADLFSDMSESSVAVYREAAADDDYPLRVVPALGFAYFQGQDGVERWRALHGTSGDRLHFGPVKLIVDGSIQGFTARMRWPGYHNGAPNGLWYVAPQQLETLIEPYHVAGAQLHIHTNGDEATEAVVMAMERVLGRHPRPDHRHTLQHCQMPDLALFRRIAALGLCCNLFANHIYYWGEQHVAQTMGLARAERMDACRTVLRLGIPLAIHSDAPVTPLGPLFTAWCAVMRRTAAGRILGEGERLTVPEALHAVTLGAAYTLKLDHLVGSLEVGKFADLAVLDADPLDVAADELRNVAVAGTILGGRFFPAELVVA